VGTVNLEWIWNSERVRSWGCFLLCWRFEWPRSFRFWWPSCRRTTTVESNNELEDAKMGQPTQHWSRPGLPGFTAEASLSRTSASQATLRRSNSASERLIVPALPIGGYAQLGCVRALCRLSPSKCGKAWKSCGGREGGVECTAAGTTV